MRIDLHTHSTESDGTDPPGEVVQAAGRAGLDVVALTDHDTTAGWDEAANAAQEAGVVLIRGMELSARSGGISVHLLSYLHDPDDPGLAQENQRVRSARRDRAQEMVGLLAADLPLTWQDVLAQTQPETTVGRPHIADALVAKGVVADRSAAFATLLHPASAYYVPHYAPDVLHVIGLVRDAGGVPVIAHPAAGRRGRTVAEAAIRRMADAGLVGIEVDHRDHEPADRQRLRALAASLGLLVTGSSDYHGAGKPNLLGENTTTPEAYAQIVSQGRIPVVGG